MPHCSSTNKHSNNSSTSSHSNDRNSNDGHTHASDNDERDTDNNIRSSRGCKISGKSNSKGNGSGSANVNGRIYTKISTDRGSDGHANTISLPVQFPLTPKTGRRPQALRWQGSDGEGTKGDEAW